MSTALAEIAPTSFSASHIYVPWSSGITLSMRKLLSSKMWARPIGIFPSLRRHKISGSGSPPTRQANSAVWSVRIVWLLGMALKYGFTEITNDRFNLSLLSWKSPIIERIQVSTVDSFQKISHKSDILRFISIFLYYSFFSSLYLTNQWTFSIWHKRLCYPELWNSIIHPLDNFVNHFTFIYIYIH